MPGSQTTGGAFQPNVPVLSIQPVIYQPTNGPISIYSGILVLTKATAAACILASPGANDDGLELTIMAGSAAAHVVTGSYQDGVTGGTKTTATFGAFVGASMTLVAIKRTWYVKALNVVTIT